MYSDGFLQYINTNNYVFMINKIHNNLQIGKIEILKKQIVKRLRHGDLKLKTSYAHFYLMFSKYFSSPCMI